MSRRWHRRLYSRPARPSRHRSRDEDRRHEAIIRLGNPAGKLFASRCVRSVTSQPRAWPSLVVDLAPPHRPQAHQQPTGVIHEQSASGSPSAKVYCLEASLGQAQDLGDIAAGRRRIVPLTGGTLKGPEITGKLLPGTGADWQIVLPDSTAFGDIRRQASSTRPISSAEPEPCGRSHVERHRRGSTHHHGSYARRPWVITARAYGHPPRRNRSSGQPRDAPSA